MARTRRMTLGLVAALSALAGALLVGLPVSVAAGPAPGSSSVRMAPTLLRSWPSIQTCRQTSCERTWLQWRRSTPPTSQI